MNGAISCQLIGRFGNQVMAYLFSRAYAERHGFALHGPKWYGDEIFDISPMLPQRDDLPDRCDKDWQDGESFRFTGYAQSQRCMIYTKAQAQSWLKFRPEILEKLDRAVIGKRIRLCHLRRGDFFGYGYPVVSRGSYRNALDGLGFSALEFNFVSEESSLISNLFPDYLSFLPDFYRLTQAPILLRANSSFSWCAGLLNDGIVMSPIIDGLEGGKEHDCEFVAGNWPRLSNFDFVTDLHVLPR